MEKERTMNKKELKRRGKGLLALLLAFMMMFGSSMTVFAGNTYRLDIPLGGGYGGYTVSGDPTGLTTGQKLEGGDIIEIVSGSLMVTIDGGGSLEEKYNDVRGMLYVELPAGGKYQVDSYSAQLPDPKYPRVTYNVALSTVPATPSGSTGNTSTESSGNTSNESTGNASTESGSDDTGNEYWKSHVHTFSWVTTQEATAEQDGIQENRCSCGLVQDTTVISASQVILREFYDMIRNAPADGTVSYDSGSLYTFSDKMLECLAVRSDVTLEVSFVYQGTAYKMTIPAGCDYSALLSDEDAFYGYFYFAQQTGAKIEPIS